MTQKLKLPLCCGHEMKLKTDLGKFIEAHCAVCKDIVYIKRQEITKPQMLDD